MIRPFRENEGIFITCDDNCHLAAGGDRANYHGTDYSKSGQPFDLLYIEDGYLTQGYDPAGANFVKLFSKDKTREWQYLHMSSFQPVNRDIKEGEFMGVAGMTGYATGIHLHLALILNGVRVDPEKYLSDHIKMAKRYTVRTHGNVTYDTDNLSEFSKKWRECKGQSDTYPFKDSASVEEMMDRILYLEDHQGSLTPDQKDDIAAMDAMRKAIK